mgnify:CR=1 FL=1
MKDRNLDIIWGVTVQPECMAEILPPEPLTMSEKIKAFWHEFWNYYLFPALLTTISVGCWAYFVASIFKWVLK